MVLVLTICISVLMVLVRQTIIIIHSDILFAVSLIKFDDIIINKTKNKYDVSMHDLQ